MSDVGAGCSSGLQTDPGSALAPANESKLTQMPQAEHHGLKKKKKKASPGYLSVTSGILEDVMSDKSRRASLCGGLSGTRRAPASAWAEFSLACAEIPNLW